MWILNLLLDSFHPLLRTALYKGPKKSQNWILFSWSSASVIWAECPAPCLAQSLTVPKQMSRKNAEHIVTFFQSTIPMSWDWWLGHFLSQRWQVCMESDGTLHIIFFFVVGVKSEKLFGNVTVGECCILFTHVERRNPLNTTSANRQPYDAV